MKKGFLALLLILLVGLISYQVYQNRLQLSGKNDQAGVSKVPIRPVNKPKNVEPTFDSASSTLMFTMSNTRGLKDGMFARFSVVANAGSKNINLPISAKIDLINVTGTSSPITVSSVKVVSELSTSTIPAGTKLPVHFTNKFSISTSTMVLGGQYKAVLRQLYVDGKTYETKMGTNVLVYLP